MFADLELAARIENAESTLTREAATQVASSGCDPFAIEIGGGVGAFLRSGSPMNKVIGIFSEFPKETELVRLERLYQDRAEPIRVKLSTLARAGIGRRLTERGYRLLGFENVLGRTLKADEFVPHGLAKRNGIAAGGASMRISSDIALMTGAATLKEHRRCGVQGARLARRICDAVSLGAQIAVITTSGGSSSQANAMRHGFNLLYSRAILVFAG
jgi:hypothetical protein